MDKGHWWRSFHTDLGHDGQPSSGSLTFQGPRPGCHLSATGAPPLPTAQKSVRPSLAAATWMSAKPSAWPRSWT